MELEEEERLMKDWCQVRRQNSQEEKEAATMTRGWEEFKSLYPHLAHTWILACRESEAKRQELREAMVERKEELERREKSVRVGKESEVKKWLRAGGVWGRGGDIL